MNIWNLEITTWSWWLFRYSEQMLASLTKYQNRFLRCELSREYFDEQSWPTFQQVKWFFVNFEKHFLDFWVHAARCSEKSFLRLISYLEWEMGIKMYRNWSCYLRRKFISKIYFTSLTPYPSATESNMMKLEKEEKSFRLQENSISKKFCTYDKKIETLFPLTSVDWV